MIRLETDSSDICYQTKIENNNEQCQHKGAKVTSNKLESTTSQFKIFHAIQFSYAFNDSRLYFKYVF